MVGRYGRGELRELLAALTLRHRHAYPAWWFGGGARAPLRVATDAELPAPPDAPPADYTEAIGEAALALPSPPSLADLERHRRRVAAVEAEAAVEAVSIQHAMVDASPDERRRLELQLQGVVERKHDAIAAILSRDAQQWVHASAALRNPPKPTAVADAPGYDAARAPPASRGSDAVAHAAHVAVQHEYWRKHNLTRLAPQHAAAPEPPPRRNSPTKMSPASPSVPVPKLNFSRPPPGPIRLPSRTPSGTAVLAPAAAEPTSGKGATPRGWQRVHTLDEAKDARSHKEEEVDEMGFPRRRQSATARLANACVRAAPCDSPRAAAAAAAAHVGASPALSAAVATPSSAAGTPRSGWRVSRTSRQSRGDSPAAKPSINLALEKAHEWYDAENRLHSAVVEEFVPPPVLAFADEVLHRNSAEMSAFDDEMSAGAGAAHFGRPPQLAAVAPGSPRKQPSMRKPPSVPKPSVPPPVRTRSSAAPPRRRARRARRRPTRRRRRRASARSGRAQVLHMKLRPPPSPRKP